MVVDVIHTEVSKHFSVDRVQMPAALLPTHSSFPAENWHELTYFDAKKSY